MREIDLLLLEDLMLRPNFHIPSAARALQTGCVLIVSAGVPGLLLHALTRFEARVALGKLPASATETASSLLGGFLGGL